MASGFMDLVLMPVMSRTKLLKFFNKFNKGGDFHKQDPNIFSVIKARSVEMRITNIDNFPEWEREIQIAIDGETYPLQPLRVDSLHGFLNFMCC
jgi:diacylglycerol kinase family enzyme